MANYEPLSQSIQRVPVPNFNPRAGVSPEDPIDLVRADEQAAAESPHCEWVESDEECGNDGVLWIVVKSITFSNPLTVCPEHLVPSLGATVPSDTIRYGMTSYRVTLVQDV